MISVNVFSEEKAWSKRLKNKDIFFKKICKAFPKKYKFFNKKVTFTLLLSNNKNIKKLNKVFRNKNKSTDILSFPLNKKIKISKNAYLGDIIINYNYLDKPKSQDLKLFKEKVIKLFIHGFLHLLGFDHIKNKDYSKMLREENFLFKSVKSKIN
jgi:probable rRNA maturation factor